MGNKRIAGAASFASTFEVSASGPLDARMLVNAKDDLFVSGSFPVAYPGMIVAVASENKLYILKQLPYTELSNWRQVGSGANTVVTSSTRKSGDSYDEIFTGMMVTESNTGDVYVYKGPNAEVQRYSSNSQFPAEGQAGILYVDTTAGKTYAWSNGAYSETTSISTDSNWSKVGDDSGTIGGLSSDVTNIAALNTVKENVTSWNDDTTNSLLTGGKLRTYDMTNNTTTEVSGAAISIPYAATNKAGVMSSTDKKAVNALTDSNDGILTYSNSAYTVNTISNADIDTICNSSAQSGS